MLCTVPLTSNLSVHTCPLASDSKATRVCVRMYTGVAHLQCEIKHLRTPEINANYSHSFSRAHFFLLQLLHIVVVFLQLVNHA